MKSTPHLLVVGEIHRDRVVAPAASVGMQAQREVGRHRQGAGQLLVLLVVPGKVGVEALEQGGGVMV